MNNPTVLPSEREFSPQTVCVPMSGLYLARALKPDVPGTKAEAVALMAACGVTDWWTVGRFNFTKLAAGMKARYGLIGQVVEGAAAAKAAVRAAVAAGPCVVGLAGNQLNLTPHWQSGSIGHAIAVMYPSGSTGTQIDPLAPAGYTGDSFTLAELDKFASAAIIFEETRNMDPVTLRPVRQEWTTGVGDPGGVFFTGGPGLGRKKQFNTATRVTSIAEDAVLYNGVLVSGTWRVVLYGQELLWFPRSSITPIADTRFPANGFGLDFGNSAALIKAQADLAAALARIATMKKKVAAGAADISDD